MEGAVSSLYSTGLQDESAARMKKSESIDANRVLAQFLLRNDAKRPTNVIDAIAESLGYSVVGMLQVFVKDADSEEAQREWQKLFGEIPFDETRDIGRDWKLRSMSDLSALHMLCCAIAIRAVLLLQLSDSGRSAVFSLSVGKVDARFVEVFLCGNAQTFYLAEPMVRERVRGRKKIEEGLTRTVLPGKGAAVYVNPEKVMEELESLGNEFEGVCCHFVVDPSLTAPILQFRVSGKDLTIEVRHPQDDLTRDTIVKTLQGCSARFTTTEPAIERESALGVFENAKFCSGSFIVQRLVKKREVVLKPDNPVKCLSDLCDLVWAFEKTNFPVVSDASALGMHEVLRMFAPFVTNKPVFESEYAKDLPIIMKHIDGFAIGDAANHPFASFLCLHSLFHAAANSQTLVCKRCHHNRRSEENRKLVMIPMRKENSPYLRWICCNCWKRMTTHEHAMLKTQFPLFHEVINIDNMNESNENKIAKLQSTADRLFRSIMRLRSDPIGSLKALIPKVDLAFSSLTEVLKMFRQRMLRMKHVTAADLVTIQTSSEYKARIGTMQRAVPLPEPDSEVVDSVLFVEYLKSFFMKEPGVTDYMETVPLSEIRETLVSEASDELESRNRPISSHIAEMEINNMHAEKLSFNVHLKLDKQPPIPAKEENLYIVKQSGDNCTVSSSPVCVLKTRYVLVDLFLDGASFTALFSDSSNVSVLLYSIPVTSSAPVDSLMPELTLTGIGNCKASFAEDGKSIAVLGVGNDSNPLHILTIRDGKWQADFAGEFEGSHIHWNPQNESSVILANDDTFWVVDFTCEEQATGVTIGKKNKDSKLVSLSLVANVLWAVFSDGEAVVLAEPNPEEEEPIISQKLGNDIIDTCSASLRGDAGFLCLHSGGGINFVKSNLSSASVDVRLIGGNPNTLRFPLGIADEQPTSNTYTSRQITAAFCRAFPVLVGYLREHAFYLVDDTLKNYRPLVANLTFSAAVQATYSLYSLHTYLHSIEETQYDSSKFQTFVFIDCGAPNGGSFIDSVFGTSLAAADVDGVWVTQRVTRDVSDVIVYFRNKKANSETIAKQLVSASLYSTNVFLLCDNHRVVADAMQLIDSSRPVRQKLNPTVVLFMSCAGRKSFESHLVEKSLKNDWSSVSITLESMELVQGPVDLNSVPGTKEKWLARLNATHNTPQDATITSIKKTLALFGTFCQFSSVDMQRITKVLGLR